MLANLAPGTEGDIVAENIRAVQAIYFAHHLESMRAFEKGIRAAEKKAARTGVAVEHVRTQLPIIDN